MKRILKNIVKIFLRFYVVHFPIRFNDNWIYMNPGNIELVPPMLLGKYEFGMTKLIKRIVKKGWTICEIGAYIGEHTPLFSNLIGKSGSVISVEPQLPHFKLLLKNIKLNKLTNVTPIKTAVSDTEDFLTMYIPLDHSVDGRIYEVKNETRKRQRVATKTIDHLLNQYKSVDLIKIDIQGWEERAIKGARKTFIKNPNILLIIEFWPKGLKEAGTNPLKLLNNIKVIGFNIYTIDEDTGKLKEKVNFPQLIKDVDDGVGGFTDLLCSRNKIGPNFKD